MTAVADLPLASASRPSLWLTLAAPALILVTLVTQFFRLHSYDLLQPECLILIGTAAVIGVAVGGLSRLRPSTLEPLLIGFLLLAFIIMHPELSYVLWTGAGMVLTVTSEKAAVFGFLVAALVCLFLLCWLLRQHLSAIISVGFGTALLATILLTEGAGGQPVRAGALPGAVSDLPPLIHIILDEHIGLAGIPLDIRGGREAASLLRSTYRDFALHSHAYSRFAQTELSLTSLMSGNSGPDLSDVLLHLEGGSHSYRLESNEWFKKLRDQKYAISVYQSSYLDFCRFADACYTYPNSLSTLPQVPLTTAERTSTLFSLLTGPDVNIGLYPIGALGALHRFIREIEQRPRGTAYILHLVLPHDAYLYQNDCSISAPSGWTSRGDHRDKVMNTPDERRARYETYLSQVICVSNKIGELFSALKQIGIYDEAAIIVHGDHGSRIAEMSWSAASADELSEQDMLDHYSTLLAVKTPNDTTGESPTPIAIQDYFAERFLGIRTDRISSVFLRETGGQFKTREIRWPDQ